MDIIEYQITLFYEFYGYRHPKASAFGWRYYFIHSASHISAYTYNNFAVIRCVLTLYFCM